MNNELKNRVKEYLCAHKEELAEELSALVRIPSVKGAPEKDAPTGRETDRMLEAAVELFRKNGFSAAKNQYPAAGFDRSAAEKEKTSYLVARGVAQ